MAIISGNTNNNGRIYVINQDTNLVEHTEEITTGSYLIRYVTEGTKSILFRKEDGKTESFGNVEAYSPAIAGAMYYCGRNNEGQLGLGNTISTSVPTIAGTDTDWKSVSSGYYHTLALKTDGTLWGCGSNAQGQLGLNDIVNRSVFTKIGSDSNWNSISCGYYNTLALKIDGTLWSCGYNFYGQLGQNDLVNRSTFTKVGTAIDWKSVSGSLYHTLALKTDGTLWSCGLNGRGQLGQNDIVNRSTFTKIGTATNWKSVSSGYEHTLALKTDGTLWSCGYNAQGQLGLNISGATNNRSTLTQIGTDTDWINVNGYNYSTIAQKINGTLWSCGYNAQGQLGLNDIVDRSTLIQIGNLGESWSDVKSGSASSSLYILKEDGTLWGCGQNTSGQLGLNDIVNRSTLIQIGSATDWKEASSGSSHAVFLK